jgi:N-(2-amino-2-carboxyethyl)-L-glutamate synthase
MPALRYRMRGGAGLTDDLSTFIRDDLFVTVPEMGIFSTDVNIKCEGLTLGGSIKFKTALAMIEDLESRGVLTGAAGGRPQEIIESSSGNLGVALSMVCAGKGIAFTCVTDPNIAASNLELMKAIGANVVVITRRDDNGGFLASRISYIRSRLEKEPHLVWTNQYANEACKLAHKRWTCPAIRRAFPKVDYLFVGAGSTGTLMGCCEYFRENCADTRVVGVDSVGSVTFFGVAHSRYIPGIGTSRRPELFNADLPHLLVQIPEADTVRMCREMRDRVGLLLGGSTGTVLAAVKKLKEKIPADAVVVALSPDLGDRYADTIYNDSWVAKTFPAHFDAAVSTA